MQCYNVNQSGTAPCGPFHPRGPSLLCVAVITASMKLSGEICAVQHGSYAVNKFELGRPSERGENGWEHFFVTNENMNMKKDNKNNRPLNLVCVSCAL